MQSFQKWWMEMMPPTSEPQGEPMIWDFVNNQGKGALCGYDYGGARNAHFTGQSSSVPVVGDMFLIRMHSGKAGEYRVFWVRPYASNNLWAARCWFVGYRKNYVIQARSSLVVDGIRPSVVAKESAPSEKQTTIVMANPPKLTYPMPGGVQPGRSGVVDLSDGFTLPTSEFWKILARDEAARNRTSSAS